MVHEFGGHWTERKFDILGGYLKAYSIALKRQRFRTVYIDAFAGTGSRSTGAADDIDRLPLEDAEAAKVVAGSARIALDVDPSFDHYVFIEKSNERFRELVKLADAFPEKRESIEFISEDANHAIIQTCAAMNWRRYRGVVFLDPYGMQVDWSTLQAIAATKALDLWYLVPTGMGITRMTPRDGQFPSGWEKRLDRMIGDQGWRRVFYSEDVFTDLFGQPDIKKSKTAGVAAVENYFLERLRTVFPGVLDQVYRLGPRGNAMYMLTFACSNPTPAAQKLAFKLARHMVSKDSKHGR